MLVYCLIARLRSTTDWFAFNNGPEGVQQRILLAFNNGLGGVQQRSWRRSTTDWGRCLSLSNFVYVGIFLFVQLRSTTDGAAFKNESQGFQQRIWAAFNNGFRAAFNYGFGIVQQRIGRRSTTDLVHIQQRCERVGDGVFGTKSLVE